MGGEKKVAGLVMIAAVLVCYGGRWGAEAQIHHVVGDDRGWDIASDIASWASSRSFAVGDFIWFAYSGGIDKDNVVELSSKEEFERCDLSNPIKMYTDGLDKISLGEEGIRYFASTNAENCKRGLKLPVDVKSSESRAVINRSSSEKKASLAQGPTSPSSSTKIYGPILFIISSLFLSLILLI